MISKVRSWGIDAKRSEEIRLIDTLFRSAFFCARANALSEISDA